MNREKFLEAVEVLKCLLEGPHITIAKEAALTLIKEVQKYRKEHPEDCYCTDDVEDSYYEISADNPSVSDDEWAEFLEQLSSKNKRRKT